MKVFTEEWKPVSGFPGYSISTEKRVRRDRDGLLIIATPKSLIRFSSRESKSINFLMNENWKFLWTRELEEGEEYKEVIGFPDYYVTSHARVWSGKKQRWLKLEKDRCYRRVHLNINGKKIKVSLHRLVAQHFLPDWDKNLFVCHKKEELPEPYLNYPDNLWMGTPADNSADMSIKGRASTWKRGLKCPRPGQSALENLMKPLDKRSSTGFQCVRYHPKQDMFYTTVYHYKKKIYGPKGFSNPKECYEAALEWAKSLT